MSYIFAAIQNVYKLITVLHDFEVSLFALETETCYLHMLSHTSYGFQCRSCIQNYTKDMGTKLHKRYFIIPETMEQSSKFGAKASRRGRLIVNLSAPAVATTLPRCIFIATALTYIFRVLHCYAFISILSDILKLVCDGKSSNFVQCHTRSFRILRGITFGKVGGNPRQSRVILDNVNTRI